MQIINDIRNSVNLNVNDSLFNYGRMYDTALASANLDINSYFVHLDPVEFNGVIDENETAVISIGFLLQDSPNSSFDSEDNLEISDSIEVLQEKCKDIAIDWLTYFRENYRYNISNYAIVPVTRVKNVMSGVLLTFNASYKQSC